MKHVPLFLWFSLATMFVGYRMAMYQVTSGGDWGNNGWTIVAVIITGLSVLSSFLLLLDDY